MEPFTIDTMGTSVDADPARWRKQFEAVPVLRFSAPFTPALAERVMARASTARFVDDDVARIGTREVEGTPQIVGGMLSVLLGRPELYGWLEAATGVTPIRGVAGRLVQTRANGRDALAWHDDIDGVNRKLGVVVHLSNAPYEGGLFEMRRVSETQPFLSSGHEGPVSMTIFAVNRELEHRVTEVSTGGPRRVWAGWFLAAPEQRGLPGA